MLDQNTNIFFLCFLLVLLN
jgi:hypothetical protein